MNLNNKSGYVCPSCRMVFTVSRAMGGSMVYCPGCDDELSLPELADNVAVLGEAVVDYSGGSEAVVVDHHRGSDSDGDVAGGGKVAVIILSGLAAILMIAGLGYFLLSGWNDDLDGSGGVVVRLDDEVDDSDEDVTEEAFVFDPEDAEQSKRLEEFLSGLFAAKTVDDLMPYVDKTPRIREKMESYYDGKDIPDTSYKLLHKAVMAPGYPGYVRFNCQTKDFENHVGVVRFSEDEILLDWESFVAYCEMSWLELAEKKPTDPVMLRVVAKKAHYYNGDFIDEDKWQAVVLTTPGEEEPIYGYVKKGSSDAGRLFNFGLSNNQGFIITVSFPESATEGNQVLINSVEQSGWLKKKEK